MFPAGAESGPCEEGRGWVLHGTGCCLLSAASRNICSWCSVSKLLCSWCHKATQLWGSDDSCWSSYQVQRCVLCQQNSWLWEWNSFLIPWIESITRAFAADLCDFTPVLLISVALLNHWYYRVVLDLRFWSKTVLENGSGRKFRCIPEGTTPQRDVGSPVGGNVVVHSSVPGHLHLSREMWMG